MCEYRTKYIPGSRYTSTAVRYIRTEHGMMILLMLAASAPCLQDSLDRIIEHRVWSAFISLYFKKDYYYKHIQECASPPSKTGFPSSVLDNQDGANTERFVVGKVSARCLQRRPFWHRQHLNCGDTEHGKSAQAGAISTVIGVIGVR